MRKNSYNLHPAASGKPGDMVVWADGPRRMIVNLLINGVTGEVDQRLIRRCNDLWYKEGGTR